MFTKKVVLAFLTFVGVLLFVGFLGSAPEEEVIASSGPEGAFSSNLPIIFRALPTSTPTPTPSPTPLPSPTATSAPGSTGDIRLVQIYYNPPGSTEGGEYVVIRNFDANGIQLQNWTLRDNANHVFTFPSFVIQPNQTCRVYTNENHPEWCSFNYGSGSAIWNNTGDTATLRNSFGQTVDTCTYTGSGTTANC